MELSRVETWEEREAGGTGRVNSIRNGGNQEWRVEGVKDSFTERGMWMDESLTTRRPDQLLHSLHSLHFHHLMLLRVSNLYPINVLIFIKYHNFKAVENEFYATRLGESNHVQLKGHVWRNDVSVVGVKLRVVSKLPYLFLVHDEYFI